MLSLKNSRFAKPQFTLVVTKGGLLPLGSSFGAGGMVDLVVATEPSGVWEALQWWVLVCSQVSLCCCGEEIQSLPTPSALGAWGSTCAGATAACLAVPLPAGLSWKSWELKLDLEAFLTLRSGFLPNPSP